MKQNQWQAMLERLAPRGITKDSTRKQMIAALQAEYNDEQSNLLRVIFERGKPVAVA